MCQALRCSVGRVIILRQMRLFYVLLMTAMFVGWGSSIYGQYSIPDQTKAQVKLAPQQSQKVEKTPFEIVNDALLRDRRRQWRKEHNYLEIKNSIQFTQFAYNQNWASGGDNTFNGRITSYLKHSYTNKKLNINTEWDAAYGLSNKDKKPWKTEDQFKINTSFNYQIIGKLYYNFNVDFRSQFANGFNSVDDMTLVSQFLSPATLNLAIGLNYKFDDKRNIVFSPLSGNMLFVKNKYLSEQGAFGVEKGKKFKPNVGMLLRVQWTQSVLKDKQTGKDIITYRADGQGFYDYKNVPTLDLQQWIDISVLKYLSLNFNCRLIFDDQISRIKEPATATTPAVMRSGFWQFSEVLGIGVSYKFANKVIKKD